jgi:hypothetical protein
MSRTASQLEPWNALRALADTILPQYAFNHALKPGVRCRLIASGKTYLTLTAAMADYGVDEDELKTKLAEIRSAHETEKRLEMIAARAAARAERAGQRAAAQAQRQAERAVVKTHAFAARAAAEAARAEDDSASEDEDEQTEEIEEEELSEIELERKRNLARNAEMHARLDFHRLIPLRPPRAPRGPRVCPAASRASERERKVVVRLDI